MVPVVRRRDPSDKDPVAQAQDCRHVLLRLLAQYGSEAATACFAYLVAFPFTGIGPGWSYAGCTRDMILADSDLPAAAERIRAAIDRRGAGYAPLTGAGLESLLEVLEGQLPGQTSLLSWAEENEAYVDQLTRDQAKVARILREQRRLKVIASAGTGKTWLALEHARLLAAAGERAALVCYSRGLARSLQRMTAQWPPAHQPMRTSATPSRSPRCSAHSAPGRPGTAAWTARRSGSCNAHRTRRSTRLMPRLTGSSARAGSRDRSRCS